MTEFSLWDQPAEEIAQAKTAQHKSLAVAAVEPMWSFLSAAKTLPEFEQRMALSEDSIRSLIAQVVPDPTLGLDEFRVVATSRFAEHMNAATERDQVADALVASHEAMQAQRMASLLEAALVTEASDKTAGGGYPGPAVNQAVRKGMMMGSFEMVNEGAMLPSMVYYVMEPGPNGARKTDRKTADMDEAERWAEDLLTQPDWSPYNKDREPFPWEKSSAKTAVDVLEGAPHLRECDSCQGSGISAMIGAQPGEACPFCGGSGSLAAPDNYNDEYAAQHFQDQMLGVAASRGPAVTALLAMTTDYDEPENKTDSLEPGDKVTYREDEYTVTSVNPDSGKVTIHEVNGEDSEVLDRDEITKSSSNAGPAVTALLDTEAAFFHHDQAPNSTPPGRPTDQRDLANIDRMRQDRQTEESGERQHRQREEEYYSQHPAERAEHQTYGSRQLCASCPSDPTERLVHMADFHDPDDVEIYDRNKGHEFAAPFYTCVRCGTEQPDNDSERLAMPYCSEVRAVMAKRAVNESAQGAERYQHVDAPATPAWIHDAWGQPNIPARFTEEGKAAFERDGVFGDRLTTVRQAAQKQAATLDDLDGIPQSTDFGNATHTQPLTTRPRVHPAEHKAPTAPDVPDTDFGGAAPNVGYGGDMGSGIIPMPIADPSMPTPEQVVGARIARLTAKVLTDNPSLSRTEAHALAAQVVSTYPEMISKGV